MEQGGSSISWPSILRLKSNAVRKEELITIDSLISNGGPPSFDAGGGSDIQIQTQANTKRRDELR